MDVDNKGFNPILRMCAMIESEEITVSNSFALHITSFSQRLKDFRYTTLFLFHIWMNI